MRSSRPLLSRSGCILLDIDTFETVKDVLVPFYRGAVVFTMVSQYMSAVLTGSRPLLSRSGCISFEEIETIEETEKFSSPFIEERLYFWFVGKDVADILGSRPLLSRSGCILRIG